MLIIALFFASLWVVLQSPPANQGLDAFMAQVLERRDINWDRFYNYGFKEREVLEFAGTLQVAPIQGFERKYVWFVRDGYLVRSPLTVNGVRVSEEERNREEREWIESLEEEEREDGVDRDRFFGFKFEPGNYYYAGRREFEGREVVVVEYYPEAAFHDEEDEDEEDEIEAKLEKVFLVTMLIDPEERQIVQMTLDNVGLEFLPGRWLVQVSKVEATMTMHKVTSVIFKP